MISDPIIVAIGLTAVSMFIATPFCRSYFQKKIDSLEEELRLQRNKFFDSRGYEVREEWGEDDRRLCVYRRDDYLLTTKRIGYVVEEEDPPLTVDDLIPDKDNLKKMARLRKRGR